MYKTDNTKQYYVITNGCYMYWSIQTKPAPIFFYQTVEGKEGSYQGLFACL